MDQRGAWAFVERPDALVWYHDTGSDLPIALLLHGLAGHALEWTTTIAALQDSFTVIAVEQRGHGSSTRRPEDVSRQAYVDDVVAVLDDLQVDEVLLVGQSMGAHTAMLVAAQHPRLVDRLVMVEGGLGGEGPASVAAVHDWLAGWPAPFADRDAFVQFFGGSPVVARAWADSLDERPDGLWPQWDADVLADALSEVAERPYLEEWAAVTAPTLLVRGEHGMISGDQLDRMLTARPETRLVTVPGAGHDVHLEQTEAWLGALQEFLAD